MISYKLLYVHLRSEEYGVVLMRSKLLPLISVLGLALGLSACSSDPMATADAEPTAEETEERVEEEASADPDLPSDEDLEAYAAAIASQSVSDLEAAEDLVVDGSPAANYLAYYTHLRNASIDSGGVTPEPATMDDLEHGFELCFSDLGETSCTTYTDFKGREGKITDFLVQDQELSQRLVSGDGERAAGPNGAEVEFVAAYLNADDTHLIYTFTVRSGSEPMYSPMLSYRNPDGRQTNSEYVEGAWELPADSYSSYVGLLPAGELGGEAIIELWPEESDMTSVTLEVPEPEQDGDSV